MLLDGPGGDVVLDRPGVIMGGVMGGVMGGDISIFKPRE